MQDQKKLKLAFFICVGLLVLAVVVSLLFAGTGSDEAIVLSEVVASNRTCPAPNGQYLDYVEIHNTSDSPVDVSGFMVSDKPDAIGYTFPQGTVIPAGGYAVCWCDKNAESPSYGAFGISNDGTDTLYLYNSANVVIDQLDVPVLGSNVPYQRNAQGIWGRGTLLTPGYENTEKGYAQWLAGVSATNVDVVISEVVTGGNCLDADGSGRATDWVELYNQGKQEVDLTGAWLSDDPAEPVKWQLPQLVLQPGQYAVIRCAGDRAQEGDANFSLSRDGCTVSLTGVMGNCIHKVEVPLIGRDISYAMDTKGEFAPCDRPTPGFENTESGYSQWLRAVGAEQTQLVISEVLPANYSSPISGQLYDWVELYNPGSSAVDLTGYYLSDDADNRGKWQLPALTIEPGQYLVIPCAGTRAKEDQAPFSLSRDGCSALLTGPKGNVLCQADIPAMERDRSWSLHGDDYTATLPTPGYANTESGRRQFLESGKPLGAVSVNEAMPANDSYMRQSDGGYHDWVELRNVSDKAIDLSQYFLTNDPDQPQLFQLPAKTLEPGQHLVVICCGQTALTGDGIYAPFTLSRDESWVYLYGPEGLSDVLHILDVPYGGSVGHADNAGTYYFTKPTPAATNGAGALFISDTPKALTQEGIYNDVSALSVELSGDDLRYTTDGSIPGHNSTVYTGPISLDKTTVLRFASFQDGKLPSDCVTAVYIINENHTLPVLSISTAPDNLFAADGLYEDYTTEREVRCNATLFEQEGGGFNVDCGLKMYGHMGLTLPKKSFKINFRGRYGLDYLSYPVYGEDGPQIYDSLVIRSGQDYPQTIFRDELFTSLCQQTSDSVLAQRDKHCILYLNGNYWGIYTIKEAFSETMYAENYGVDQSTVTMVQAPVATYTEIFSLLQYCKKNDLSVQENYEYFASRMNISSLIDWLIFEGYGSNSDIQQNLRYFKSTANGDKWQFAYYDLDWAWYFPNGFINVMSPEREWQHLPFGQEPFANAQFREQFFTRCAELKNGVLSNESVLARIDHYKKLLAPEVQREKARWGGSYGAWEKSIEKMRSYITENDHWGRMINQLRSFAGLTDAEYEKYFGGGA